VVNATAPVATTPTAAIELSATCVEMWRAPLLALTIDSSAKPWVPVEV
jgi:hypothetical protein